jgi:hypothetical protein
MWVNDVPKSGRKWEKRVEEAGDIERGEGEGWRRKVRREERREGWWNMRRRRVQMNRSEKRIEGVR